MARRRTRRTTSRRRAPARRSAPVRRRRTTTTRRRRTRRRNPSFKVKDTLFGAAGGALLGIAAYALGQQNLSPTTHMIAVGAGGLLLGAAASGWKPSIGAGIAGGAGAIAAGYGAQMLYQRSQNAQTSYMAGMGYRRALPPAIGAVRAPVGPQRQLVMSGVGPSMGAVVAPVAPGLQAELNGLS